MTRVVAQSFAASRHTRFVRFFLAVFAPSAVVTSLAFPQESLADAPTYVGSDKCAECHREATDAWASSHHALAWTAPSSKTVVADFDKTEFRHNGVLTSFRVEGGAYHVTVREKDGVIRDYQVHSVVGIEPLQQYLLETEPGRLQSFDVVWDVERARWFHLYPDQNLPPGNGLHWTGPYKNWNARCAECHATGFEKNYDPEARSYASTQSEMGVGCEACHGPGSNHLDWAHLPNNGDQTEVLSGYGFTMDFAAAGTEASIQQCAGCHSRREAQGDGNPLPGTPYHDAYILANLRPGLYYADGQILDEVYVYGSFLQSKMYAKGVGCSNCHDAHSAKLKADGNAVCTQCHSPAGNPDFPTLKPAAYDSPVHHFHAPDSDGAQCKNCHMIERVYMGVDGRRDHSFRVPRPDLADETGAPNACSDCHKDRTPEWAAAEIAARYPHTTARGSHYGVVLAKGRTDPAKASASLVTLAESADQPGIVRATALWLLEQGADADVAERLAPLLEDPDPLVRAAAIGVQRAAPPQDRISRIAALLDDPVRSVRIEAAKDMIDAPVVSLPRTMADDLNSAMSEWRGGLLNRIDFPETHLVLGGVALTTRNLPAASEAFREVVRLDPQHIEAWIMLARLAAATGGAPAATSVLNQALISNPDDPTIKRLINEINSAQ